MTKAELCEIIKSNRSNYCRILKYKFPDFYKFIILNYNGETFSEKLYSWIEEGNIKNHCIECGKNTKFIGINDGYREFCSNLCVNKNKTIKTRILQSYRNKYGVDNISQLEEVKDKKKKTFNLRYGVNHPCLLPENKEKAIQAKRINYDNTKESSNQLKKLSMLHRKRFIEDCITGNRLGGKLTPMFDMDTFTRFSDQNLKFKCNTCDSVITGHMKWGTVPRCRKCCPSSMFENSVVEYIKENWKFEVIQNSFGVLNNRNEVDIYIPELKIGIELNGDYWHSVDKKNIGYHLNKTQLAEALDIKLVHITENEWYMENTEVKKLLYEIFSGNPPSNSKWMITEEHNIIFNRRIYNRSLITSFNYDIITELPPTIEYSGNEKFYNCGYLIAKHRG